MKRKVSCVGIWSTFAILSHIVVLVGIGLLLRAGSGPIKNDLPADAGRYMVLVSQDSQYLHAVLY